MVVYRNTEKFISREVLSYLLHFYSIQTCTPRKLSLNNIIVGFRQLVHQMWSNTFVHSLSIGLAFNTLNF